MVNRVAARRIVCAFVAAETRRLRATASPSLDSSDWPETTAIGDDGLGLDSIEQLGALGILAETFDLADDLLDGTPPRIVADWVDWVMRGIASGSGRLTVRTSGSTGVPRPCVHAIADLVAEATYLADRLRDRRRVVALVPAHHLYGIIWTALLPAALDVPVVVAMIGARLDIRPGDLVVAVPEQWQLILQLSRRFPDDIVGVSSAGSMERTLAADLLGAGLARLIDVYGSSETGAIAMRDVPATGYELLPRWHLRAHGERDWQLVDGTGRAVPLPDHVERIGDRLLRPIGRRDGSVQVAGHNVSPERVTEILRATDGVADAAVRLGASGRLKAFIVAAPGRDQRELATVLDGIVATRLISAERPRSFTFGTTLPRNPMGKLDDWI